MKAVKRMMDIAAASAGLILSAPLMAAAGLAVWVSMGRPVLFRQERAGRGGAPFLLYKLRTMKAGEGPDAERLTRLGGWLRERSLDELPQLWNVLKGEMSLVGPRPLPVKYVPRYSARQRRRLEVKPGITGWAQVQGRNTLDWERRLDLDVWYVEHQSLGLDLKILLRTPWKVLRREGIAEAGHATMTEFRGARPERSSGGIQA